MPNSPLPTRRLTAPLALAAAGCLLLGLAGCDRGRAGARVEPVHPVHVAGTDAGGVAEPLRAVGVLAPKDEARLSFKTGGVVESIAVEEGATVRRGQLLASLRATEVDAQVRQAREAADKAVRDHARTRALFDDGVATQEQLDDAATVLATTRAALSAATFNARYARIEAPANGTVLRKLAQPNELVQPGQAILSVSDLGRGWVVRVGLADRDVVTLHAGDPAQVALDAFAGRAFSARVTTIGSSADPQTGTFTVEVALDPAGAGWAEGMVARVDFRRHDPGRTVRPSVPLTALVEANGDMASVFVLDAGGTHVHRRSVRLGPADSQRATIVAGLGASERVVTDGAAFLSDGDAVRIVTGDASPALSH